MAAKRILFAGGGTGGHLYPALNLADAFQRLLPEVECTFLGGERGIEATVLPRTRHPHRLLPLQPLYRQRPWRNVRLLTTAPSVVGGVWRTFRDFDPHLVVGTGGYVSGPALAAAVARRIPIAIQEQNAAPGLVTRLFAPRVDQIHLGYPEAIDRLKTGRSTEVFNLGNPVAVELGVHPPSRNGKRFGFGWPVGKTLLVFGGSQGALALNRAFLADLEWLSGQGPQAGSDNISVVWIAGPTHAGEISAKVDTLDLPIHVSVVPYIEGLGSELSHVTLALCRSGAMSLAELCAAGRPAVLVPLPTAAGDHQRTNAAALQEVGAAVVCEEAELKPGDLWSTCYEILSGETRLGEMSRAAEARGRPRAALSIAEAMLPLLAQRQGAV